MSKVTIGRVEIDFPYEPYECQTTYMKTVIDALDGNEDAALESPTGTGKTLSLLCSVLAWAKYQRGNFIRDVAYGNALAQQRANQPLGDDVTRTPRIFYASRTHSQLSQVVRELNKTLYKDVKVATLGSRDQLCINETVKKEVDNQTKVLKCANLVKRRGCHYYNNWEKADPLQLEELYAEPGKVLDIEELVSFASKQKQCPFFRARQQQERAELFLLPYNYLIDPYLRQIHKIDLKHAIVIFDEAHNLDSVCQDSFSYTISSKDIAFCIKEVKAALKAVLEKNEAVRIEMDETTAAFGAGMEKGQKVKEKEINQLEVANLLDSLQTFLDSVDDLYENEKEFDCMEGNNGKVFDGRKLIDLLQKANLRRETALQKAELLHLLANFLADEVAEEGGVALRDRGKKMLEFGSFVAKVKQGTLRIPYNDVEVYADTLEAVGRPGCTDQDIASENFKLYIIKTESKLTLNYWCFSAGIAMRCLRSRGVRCIIVTSGTLAPLKLFTASLALDFRHTLQNKHVAKSNQVVVLRIAKGANQVLLNGTFGNRKNSEYLFAIGDSLVRVCSKVPQGVLCFFSCYSLMEKCLDLWHKKGLGYLSIQDRLRRLKDVFVEPRIRAELAGIRVQFELAVQKRGAIFFAVARGKVSEGIDFADSHSRAVVIIGIPYPPFNDPRVVLKRNHMTDLHRKAKEKETVLSGEQWYVTEGFRAVNQAIGRVIRHINDFGAVVLLDSRFNKQVSANFPQWVQHSFSDATDMAAAEKALEKFFTLHSKGLGKSGNVPGMSMDTGTVERLESVPKSTATKRTDALRTTEPLELRTLASLYSVNEAPSTSEEEQKDNQQLNLLNKPKCQSSSVNSLSAKDEGVVESASRDTLKRPPLLKVAPETFLRVLLRKGEETRRKMRRKTKTE